MNGCALCEVDHPRGAPDCPAQLVGRTAGGRYRIERLLGIGGMGAVYEAVHLELGTRVAVKTIRARVAPSAESVERLRREARELGALHHPGIVEVRDLGRDEAGMPFMVMELLEGDNLADLLAGGPLAIDRAVGFAIEALDALSEAHAHSIVHRDLKPANLFLARTRDGERIKVLDFGIAKVVGTQLSTLTETGLMIGSAPYMSPEQTNDAKRLDQRSDVYAMGATLFELLTGCLTVVGETPIQVLVRIAKGEVQRHPAVLREQVPPWLDAIVAKSLATDPAERFQSAVEMRDALRQRRPIAPSAAETSPPDSAAAIGARPPAAVPSVLPPSRTPAPAVLPPGQQTVPGPVGTGARWRGRRIAVSVGIASSLFIATLVVVGPRLWGARDPADRASASDPRREDTSVRGRAPSPTAPTKSTPAPPTSPAPAPAPSTAPGALDAPAPAGSRTKMARREDRASRATTSRQDAGSGPERAGEAATPTHETAGGGVHRTGPIQPAPAPETGVGTTVTFDQDDGGLLPNTEQNVPRFPSITDVERRMDELTPLVRRCAPGRRVNARFQIEGRTGRARTIQLVGFEGTTAEGTCVAGAIRSASFPRFGMLVYPVQHSFLP